MDKPSNTRKSNSGKGDLPRKVNKIFWDNWENIKGFRKSKFK